MAHDQDQFDKELKKALPALKAPEEFKQTLKKELLNMESNIRKPGRRPVFYAAAAIAAIFIFTFALWPNSPGVDPGIIRPNLPPLTATGPETLGASPGPGFTVELDYSAGPLAALPSEAVVYRYKAVPFGKEALAAVAEKLGVVGEVTEERWQDGVTYQAGEPDQGMVIAFPNGYYSYNRPLPENLQAQTMKTETERIDAARDFLRSIGIDPDTAEIREIRSPGPDDYYPLTFVTFAPKTIANQVSYSPFAQVQVGPDGQVYSAGWLWPTELVSTIAYPLRSVEDAWRDIENGLGKIEIDLREVPGPVAGTVAEGSATIRGSFIGHILTYDDDGSIVMQPVAAFRGTAIFAGGKQLPFTVYSQGVEGTHYE